VISFVACFQLLTWIIRSATDGATQSLNDREIKVRPPRGQGDRSNLLWGLTTGARGSLSGEGGDADIKVHLVSRLRISGVMPPVSECLYVGLPKFRTGQH
jgi:hypothetical protein